MNARDEVLARVRAALGDQPAGGPEVVRSYRRGGEHPPGHPRLLELFAERLTGHGARVRSAAVDRLPQALADALADHAGPPGDDGVVRVAVPCGLSPEWLGATPAQVVVDDELTAAQLDQATAAVTAAAVAIAETGTIVLDGSPDQGRRVLSLLPDLHVCVVRTDQVVTGVPEALARLDPPARSPGSADPRPPATSSSSASKASTAHGASRL